MIPAQDMKEYNDIVTTQKSTTEKLYAGSVALATITYFMSLAMSLVWSAISTLQLLSHIALINLVKYPACTVNMFKAIIRMVTFELIPEFLYGPLKEMVLDMESDIPYSREYLFLGYETGFILDSMFTAFIIVTCTTVWYLLEYLLYTYLKSKEIHPERQKKLKTSLDERHGFYLRALMELSMEIFVCFMVEIIMK